MRPLLALAIAMAAAGCEPGTLGSAPGKPGGGIRLVDAGGGVRDDGGRPIHPPEPGVDAGPGGGRDGGGSTGTPGSDRCGDIRAVRAAVHYGTAMPTHVDLTPGQVMAIGMLSLGGSLCSGTLIAPRWVLTASHCTEGASSATFAIGPDPSDPRHEFSSRRLIDNPSADQALIELSEDVTARVPDVVPIRLITESMASGWVGRTAEAAGYGQTEAGTTGTRWFTAEPIVSVSGNDVSIDGEGRHGVCFGDSGGPVLVTASDGSTRIAGDLSNGDGSCVGVDNYTRVDIQRAWIEGYVGPTPATDPGTGPPDPPPDPSDPCLGLDQRGRCDGNVARWCDRGVLRERDCGACDQACGMITDVGAYCTGSGAPPDPSDPCMGLDYLGRCDGDTAVWCDSGMLRMQDCGASGQTCRWIDDTTGYYCGG